MQQNKIFKQSAFPSLCAAILVCTMLFSCTDEKKTDVVIKDSSSIVTPPMDTIVKMQPITDSITQDSLKTEQNPPRPRP